MRGRSPSQELAAHVGLAAQVHGQPVMALDPVGRLPNQGLGVRLPLLVVPHSLRLGANWPSTKQVWARCARSATRGAPAVASAPWYRLRALAAWLMSRVGLAQEGVGFGQGSAPAPSPAVAPRRLRTMHPRIVKPRVKFFFFIFSLF